ncbi:hypothetical protein Rsub_10063 [Raphidocelis subcapitata]|uniref:Uncharacterized protein n=1 Tax=Raphidocelis subcapitata TaxID=307507 RepID=A0A2V0PE07_9CHLO|nr:hypothetical protein Rsub_10063 [Raphidocelis subcapitata]|eukprot:GBF97202.1 hypothetical protein Rsub_10063 [Raphidocelis subcapitata]
MRERQQASAHAAAAAAPAASSSVFVDAVTGRHASPAGPAPLLARRRVVFSSSCGYAYDAAVEDPGRTALAGSNSRFSLPSIALRVRDLLGGAAGPAAAALREAAARLPALPTVPGRGGSSEQERRG